MAKRECKTCKYIRYNEDKRVIGYECTLCGRYVDGIFKCGLEDFRHDELPECRAYVNKQFDKRKGYKYWCPLVAHRNAIQKEETR